ncbi:DNA cytosine methyltransferase [Pseudactinotalea sp. Z1732]|uniref:DNA cytosine methyltransferase n=2 Tax=Micrococcales TaxID=85006 RepID=UPI003C7C670D
MTAVSCPPGGKRERAEAAPSSGVVGVGEPGPAVERGKLASMLGGSGEAAFDFVDLFAGVGGFHAVLGALGGRATFASEIDPGAARVYRDNWNMGVHGDIIPLTAERMDVPDHDVLAAGFPCQPFSKSGFQKGMEETRGTLFFNIARVLEERRPTAILLENVRNLAGPRHRDTWATIIRTLRDLGYQVSTTPTIFSPHLLPPELGGRPQVRDRVFITGTYVGPRRAWAQSWDEPVVPNRPVARPDGGLWDPHRWDLRSDLPLLSEEEIPDLQRYRLSPTETEWISVWDEFVQIMRPRVATLPGFPIWADAFLPEPQITQGTPLWKANFLRKNAEFYRSHQRVLDGWLQRHQHLAHFPASRRKLEWQAQDAESLGSTIMHFRPSGIRAKKPTYVPALVAITQTTILGDKRRRLTPREAARLQGLPDEFTFGDQPAAASYRQMGNGVNVGAAYYVLRQHLLRTIDDVEDRSPGLARAVRQAPANPDVAMAPGSALAQSGVA